MLLYVDSHFISPYAMSAFVALHEKRLPFDIRTLNLGSMAQQAAQYAQLSLTQRVPTLVDGDFALSESSAIAEYLNDVHAGPALFPDDPQQRARARQVQAWLRSDFLPIREERSAETLFYSPVSQALSAQATASALKLFDGASALLAQGGEHLCGDWCIADLDLAFMLKRLIANGDDVPAALVQYAQRQWARASVQAWLAQPRPPR